MVQRSAQCHQYDEALAAERARTEAWISAYHLAEERRRLATGIIEKITTSALTIAGDTVVVKIAASTTISKATTLASLKTGQARQKGLAGFPADGRVRSVLGD